MKEQSAKSSFLVKLESTQTVTLFVQNAKNEEDAVKKATNLWLEKMNNGEFTLELTNSEIIPKKVVKVEV